MLGATQDDRLNHLDGYGIKVLFNHGIRRFLTGAKNKDPSAQILEEKTLYNYAISNPNGQLVRPSFLWGMIQSLNVP